MGDDQTLEKFRTDVIGALARLDGKIDTLNARLEASNDRTREEIPSLFQRTHDLGERTSRIERDYVPRSAFDQHEKQQRADIATLRVSIDGVKTQVTKVIAVAGAVLVIVNVLLRVWSMTQ